MTDGITDLLVGILIMGIVIALAFSFIMPLVNSDVLQPNSDYEDKAANSNIIINSETYVMLKGNEEGYYKQYSNVESSGFLYVKEKTDDIYYTIERAYTFPELMLLLSIQDNTMTEPNTINLRNLIYKADYTEFNNSVTSYYLNVNDYGLHVTNGKIDGSVGEWVFDKDWIKFSAKKNLNRNRDVETLGTSWVIEGLKKFSENESYVESTDTEGAQTVFDDRYYNIGKFIIDDTFNGSYAVSGKSPYDGLSYIVSGKGPNKGSGATSGYFESYNAIDMTKRYFIKYECQISNGVLNLGTDAGGNDVYSNSKYSSDGWYVEVVDNRGTPTTDDDINTFMFYNYMLKKLNELS